MALSISIFLEYWNIIERQGRQAGVANVLAVCHPERRGIQTTSKGVTSMTATRRDLLLSGLKTVCAVEFMRVCVATKAYAVSVAPVIDAVESHRLYGG